MSFVSPAILVGLPLLVGLFALHRRGLGWTAGLPGGWRDLIAPDLRGYLTAGQRAGIGVSTLCCLATALLIICALARPFLGVTQPDAFTKFAGRIVVLDLGAQPKMTKVRLFSQELMETSPDLPTALVAAGAEAYTIVPFTVDAKQMLRYLNVVTPNVIPAEGRSLHSAMALAESMIARAEIPFGQIVVVSPGGAPADAVEIAPSSTDRVIVSDMDHAAWQVYGDTFDASVHSFDDTAAITDRFLNRAGSTAAAHQTQGHFDLAPLLIGFAMLTWLPLFRRRSAE